MSKPTGKHILANIPRDQFVGRSAELGRILDHIRYGSSSVISLLKAPGSGATELLKQAFDQLFIEGEMVIPIYFAFRPEDTEPIQAAERFQREFLSQVFAFQNGDPSVINSVAEISDLVGIADEKDREWVESFSRRNANVRSLLAAPLLSHKFAGRLFVMIDDIDRAVLMPGGVRLVSDLIEIAQASRVPHVIAGARRSLFGKIPGGTIGLKPPAVADSAQIADVMSHRFGVDVNEQTRDLIAVQICGNLSHMELIFRGASERSGSFDNFAAVESSYAEEIFGGRISRAISSRFDRAVPRSARSAILELMQSGMKASTSAVSMSSWREASGLEDVPFRQMMLSLHVSELVNCSAVHVAMDPDNIVLADYIEADLRLEDDESRALVFGDSLSQYLRRAPLLMGRYYRRNAAIGLKALLGRFDGQEIAAELIHYEKFKERAKGMHPDDVSVLIEGSTDKVSMPSIFFTADTSAFYMRLAELIEDERSAIALGFEDDSFREESVWIAAEIDSKLEADADKTEFWCDRLEMVAASCGFEKFTIWMVSPEGFTNEALDLLRTRNAIGSSKRQIEMLRKVILGDQGEEVQELTDEYEMVIPMGDDTEMIAARTLEDIARKHHLSPKVINQIKTALVEACINAEEHSLSPDRRIYQKFSIDADRLTITVANRGLRLLDRAAPGEIVPDEGRRGWGLKLMKSLMDEVKIEASEDGTRISMVKYLHSPN